jgi:hypothetical protein
MDHCPPPESSDLTLQLPRDLYYQTVHTLAAALPPPVTDTPEDLARRDNAAIAEVASLLPANAEEVTLAAQYVAANAQAMECLRLARKYPGDPNFILKCTAQSASMMRQARSARSLLLRVQVTRQKREADGAATDKAGWIEYCAIGLMADAPRRADPLAWRPARQIRLRPAFTRSGPRHRHRHQLDPARARRAGRGLSIPSPPLGAERVRVR